MFGTYDYNSASYNPKPTIGAIKERCSVTRIDTPIAERPRHKKRLCECGCQQLLLEYTSATSPAL